jgi:hypothetical protein
MRRGTRAVQAKEFQPPRTRRLAVWMLRHFGLLYCRLARGVCRISIEHAKPLFRAMRSFQRGDSRLLILFRHVEVADGPVVMAAIAQQLQRFSRRYKVKLPRKPHAHFLYGRDVLNWAGAGARWVFPRLGGIPVKNSRVDRQSHEAIREVITRGDYPLALAPEGQVTYQMFHVSELAAGTGTLVKWIEEDLFRLGGTGHLPGVTVLPLAIGYDYGRRPEKLIAESVEAIEGAIGMSLPRGTTPRESLLNATEAVVAHVEEAYREGFPGVVGEALNPTGAAANSSREHLLSAQIERLCDLVLQCAERSTGPSPDTSMLRRLFHLRYRIMDMIYRPDGDPRSFVPARRAWADYLAQEARGLDRHVQLVDILMYIRPLYIPKGCSEHRLMEYSLNLRDVLNRLAGGNIDSRYTPPHKCARILVGSPIDAREVFASHPDSPRTAIHQLNEMVHDSFRALSWELEERMISDYPRSR